MSVLVPNKVIRYDINTLKNEFPDKFGRFIVALKNLEESDDWYRICGIHGNTFKPNDPAVLCPTDISTVTLIAQTGEPTYCPHSNVKFIGWHTPYIYQFELLLNQYNTSVNREYISLPYLDLTQTNDNFSFLNEPTITVLFDDNTITVPNPLSTVIAYYYDNGVKTNVVRNGFLNPITRQEKNTIRFVIEEFNNCLYNVTYEDFSTKTVSTVKRNLISNTKTPPIESPHNTCHDVIGGDGGNMSNISVSAFDPLFWLHHCNIDRFFYNWLYNSTEGFTVPLNDKQISPDTLNLTLAPFFPGPNYEPESVKYGWLNDTFEFQRMYDILNFSNYPYTYNKIEKLLQATVFSVAELVDIPIPLESVKINFYLFPKSISKEEFYSQIFINNDEKDKYLAGIGYYFGINRQKKFCARCFSSRTNITINISDYLIENGIDKTNIDNYNYTIYGIGLINPGSFYTERKLLFDGTIKIIFSS